MNKIHTWRGETSNHYETEQLTLIIEKSGKFGNPRRCYATITVAKHRYKCIKVRRSDAAELLHAMWQESKNPTK